MIGGGSRPDIQSLLILRPLSVLIFAFGLFTLQAEQIRPYRFLMGLGLACVALVGAHAVPLPPGFWQQLPGRDLVHQVDVAAGLGQVWRPLSLSPTDTWNALFSLFVPGAAFLLAIQIKREERFLLLYLVLGLAVVSGVFGFFQAIGPSSGPLYLYRVTNELASVGLFANRNHQALFLAMAFPMLALYTRTGVRSEEQFRFRRTLAVLAAIILIPLLLITGSRAGLGLGLIGLLAIPLLAGKPANLTPMKRKAHQFDRRYLWGGVAVVGLAAVSVLFARAEAITRLLRPDAGYSRLGTWDAVVDAAMVYFPFGAGLGTFAQVYKVHEPAELLSFTYLNHAHNDFVELLLTGGVPAMLLIVAAIIGWGRAAIRWFWVEKGLSRDVGFGRLGVTLLFMAGLSSVVDYPLRVPSLMCLAVIAAVWSRGSVAEERAERL